MTPDRATERADDVGGGASVRGRQSSLTGISVDGSHQTTLPGNEPGSTGGHDRPASGGRTVVNAFPVGDDVLVRHYFEGDGAFAALKRYYDGHNYRFEIPRDRFRAVRAELAGHGYDLRLVDDVAPYAVAVRKYSDHPEVVFEESVVRFSADGVNVFVMTDGAAVERAVDAGASRIDDVPASIRLPTTHGTGPLAVRDVVAHGD